MIVAIGGASGFIGRALTAHLVDHGHDVLALSRSPAAVPLGATSMAIDVGDETATAAALAHVDAAYYLVHSMAAGGSFREMDLRLAGAFGRAAARAGLGRIVYLGGLGAAPQSAHLASRHEVGAALAAAGVPVVELRAAVVFGAGGISFEMVRYLTERLPVMVCPRWVGTRIQPIALTDLLSYLEQSLEVEPGVYEIGGADVTTYREMILQYARVRNLRSRRVLDLPWLTPHLSSYWVDMVTPVDRSVSHALIESLVSEVVVTDPAPTSRAFTVAPMGVEAALRAALDDQDEHLSRTLLERQGGLLDGVYTVEVEVEVSADVHDAVIGDLARIGGSVRWYGAAPGWILRLALGRLVGERLRTRRTTALVTGATVDWWRVATAEPGTLVLRSVGWWPGDAWLGYRVADGLLRQVAAFRPRGLSGFLYWKLLGPVHRVAFARMARHRAHVGRAPGAQPG